MVCFPFSELSTPLCRSLKEREFGVQTTGDASMLKQDSEVLAIVAHVCEDPLRAALVALHVSQQIPGFSCVAVVSQQPP